MYMNSSAAYAGVKANAKDFEFGVSTLPYWPDVASQPQNTIIGGATLWVLQGHDAEEYKGVAKFFSYLSSAGGAGRLAPVHRLPADHHGRCRADQGRRASTTRTRAPTSRSSR